MLTNPRHADAQKLRRLEPVSGLSELRLQELAGLCHSEKIERSQEPVRLSRLQGNSVYLLSGELKLSYDDGSFRVLVGGSDGAVWPLGKRGPLMVEARAITDIEILRIDDFVLDIMMTWDQLSAGIEKLPATVEASEWRMVSSTFRLQSLTRGALSRLPPASIDELFRRFDRVKMPAGEFILREGDNGSYYYIVEAGRCEVTRRVGGVEMVLAELKAGDAFGEEALLAETRRNATVRMKSAGVLLRLKKQDFIELLRKPLLRRVSLEQAEARVAAGARWLDVRYPSEYQYDRLPGAVNVPLSEIRNAIGLLDAAPEYIVYCQSGRRSSAAAFLLSQRGYRAYWLENGMPTGHSS